MTKKENKSSKVTFKTVLHVSGKTATGIKIPPEILEQLGGGKRPLVKVTVNNFTYRSAVAIMGGVPMVGVNSENRESAGIKGGDKIEVAIELDTEERTVDVPAEFQRILDRSSAAKKKFDTLSNSKKKAMIIPIAKAKTEETRNRNIDKAMAILGAG